MFTGICSAIVALVGLIVGVYRVFFSKDAKQDKWRKELYELEKQMDESYLTGDESAYRTLVAKHRMLISEGSASGFK